MRIAFDVTSCAKPHGGGIQNYGRALVRACARTATANEYVLLVRLNRWLRRRHVRDILPGHPIRPLAGGLEWLTAGGIDVLHGVGAWLPRGEAFAKIATIHDVRVFEPSGSGQPEWRRKRRARLLETASHADLLVALSEQGARALVAHLGVPAERVRVVPGPVDLEHFVRPGPETLRAVRKRYGLGEHPYLLCLGRLGSRKNQLGLLDAFARAAPPGEWLLAFAGPEDRAQEDLRREAQERGVAPARLRLPGRVPDADLPALLAGCGAYVCASLHEGFGRPVVEAQACGAPVLSSNRGALPETVGDCGVLFDPGDLDAFAGAIRRITADTALRRELAERGPAQARRFSEEAVGMRLHDLHHEAYERLARRRRDRSGGRRASA